MKFGSPPENLLTSNAVDKSAPELEMFCEEEIIDTEDELFPPKWLEESCGKAFFPEPQEIIRKPSNIAAARGTLNVKMNCSTINFRNYDYNSWRFYDRPGGNPEIITALDFVIVGWENLYDISGTWDLVVKEVNDATTGIYECEVYARRENDRIEENFMVFLLEMGMIYKFLKKLV